MKLKPDEIGLALNTLADLLDHKGAVLVSATTETSGGITRDVALLLDAANPRLYAHFAVDAVHRGSIDAPVLPGLYPLAPLATHLTKRKKAKDALVKVAANDAVLLARNAEGKEKTWETVSRNKRDWPKGFVYPSNMERTRKVDLNEVLETPIPFDLVKGDAFDVAPVMRAIEAIRPPGVSVTYAPKHALVYASRWFGVHFRITLREGVKGKK
jgi:hypothetical protein